MKRVSFNHIPFTQHLFQALSQQTQLNHALFIFPTQAGVRAAIREFQNTWAFQNIRFVTMEELKALLFVSDQPLLKEEKRTLAFYAALSEEHKRFFKINNYFQSIELAHHFFDLWEEFNEERLPDELDEQRLLEFDAALLDWQADTYAQLCSIKQSYRETIERKGFTDAIFLYQSQHLRLDAFEDIQHVHFVNQFYYTELEKYIIEVFAEHGAEVTLHYQLPAELVNTETLEITPFSVQDLGAGRNERINIFECKNEFTMLLALLRQIHNQPLRHVINFSPNSHPFSRFLSADAFHISSSVKCTDTSIFHVLQTAHLLIDTLVYEPTRGKLLLPIQAILDAMLNPHFSAFLLRSESRQEVLDALYDLMDWDTKFIDLDGHFFLTQKCAAVEAIKTLLKFVRSLLKIHSISDFVNFIDSKTGIPTETVFSERDIKYSNLREVFYRALADFQALEHIGVVDNWDELFFNPRLPAEARRATGIFLLFLDYLKSRSVRFTTKPVEAPRVEFTSLQDTRNIFYKHVAVMNVIESEIPHPRQTPFLCTERQRQALGLKTYDDIKLREKYYLMRLVLTTPQVTLLTQKNIENNVDVSSFVEELRLFAKDQVTVTRFEQENYAQFYDALLEPEHDYAPDRQRPMQDAFYAIPLNIERDFVFKSLNLSYYALSNLLKNPFAFYVNNLIRLEEQTKTVDADYSAKLIGNIVHECLNIVWRDLLQEFIVSPVTIDFLSISDDLIDRALHKTLQQDRFYYASTHNHAQIYFMEILLPRIKQGIRQFFEYLHRIGLGGVPLEIFPEKDEVMLRDKYVPYIKSENIDFSVNIGGRADLRLEAPETSRYYIFDYKTGGYDRHQLVLYELYYHLVEHPEWQSQVFSYFYQVLDGQGKELREFNRRKSKEQLFQEFETTVKDSVRQLWKIGFALPEKRSGLEDLPEITRKDLYLTTYLPSKNRNGLLTS